MSKATKEPRHNAAGTVTMIVLGCRCVGGGGVDVMAVVSIFSWCLDTATVAVEHTTASQTHITS